jgi:hypothetical protein
MYLGENRHEVRHTWTHLHHDIRGDLLVLVLQHSEILHLRIENWDDVLLIDFLECIE